MEKLDIIKKVLEENKAKDIAKIDLKGKTNIADFMVIANGTSSRHLHTMAEKIQEVLKAKRIKAYIEGEASDSWILVDAGSVLVHLFMPEIREKYELEKLWSDEILKLKASNKPQ
jgi:ribosome-associated protein